MSEQNAETGLIQQGLEILKHVYQPQYAFSLRVI